MDLKLCGEEHSVCRNLPGSYVCECLPGFARLQSGCEGNLNIPRQMMAQEVSWSSETSSVFATGISCLRCCVAIDIDECEGGIERCTVDHSHCTNTLGSFTCDCDAGYMSEDGKCRST